MPERSRKKRSDDASEMATAIVAEATEEPEPEKNPAAVALGKLGGKKGGLARAKALSKKRRSEIARKAAQARWSKET